MSGRAAEIASHHNLTLIRPLHFGLSNETYVAEDVLGRRYALKLYIRDTFKAQRESSFMMLASAAVPTPTCVVQGEDYVLTTFLGGVSGVDIFSRTEHADMSERVGISIGRVLAQLHTVPVVDRGIGFLGHDIRGYDTEYALHVSEAGTNTEFLRCLINENMQILNARNIALPALPDIYVPHESERVLVHHDVCPKNMLFDGNHVSGLLDFEYALVGSRLFDIAKVHILGRYFAYHTGGTGTHLAYEEYQRGFDAGYGHTYTYQELQHFYIYVLLNYIVFWVTHPSPDIKIRDRILPLHLANLRRVCNEEPIAVPPFTPW